MITIHGLGALGETVTDTVVAAALPALITDIRFRSSFSDETLLATGQELSESYQGKSSPGRASRFLYAIKPTLVLNSPVFGQKVLAPWGAASPTAVSQNRTKFVLASAAIAIGCVGLGMVLIDAVRG